MRHVLPIWYKRDLQQTNQHTQTGYQTEHGTARKMQTSWQGTRPSHVVYNAFISTFKVFFDEPYNMNRSAFTPSLKNFCYSMLICLSQIIELFLVARCGNYKSRSSYNHYHLAEVFPVIGDVLLKTHRICTALIRTS